MGKMQLSTGVVLLLLLLILLFEGLKSSLLYFLTFQYLEFLFLPFAFVLFNIENWPIFVFSNFIGVCAFCFFVT